MPITSLQYFSDIVGEVSKSGIPENYWEPLRTKVTRMEYSLTLMHTSRRRPPG
jgi:hypothetical protein